ncbi:MAG: alpha/beta fold hydrolase [Phycisphaerales bacterium JB039]
METCISRDGTRIAYDRVGEGTPVILIGGALSHRSFPQFVELSRLLSVRHTAIAYDRRGRGDSGDTAPYAVEREVEDVDALIGAVGGSAHVWGWSSGAALALRAAASGLGIEKLALYEPPYMVGNVGHRPPPDHEAKLRELVSAGRRSDAVKFFMVQMVGVPRLMVAIMRLMPFWKKLLVTAHTLPYDAAVMGDFSLPREMIASVRIPTLIAAGEKSPPVLRNAALAVAETLPGAGHMVLAGQSHNVSMKALAPALLDFFAS